MSQIKTNTTDLQAILDLVNALPEAGGSSGLPSGISEIATGTFTPTSDVTAGYSVSHGLTREPSFVLVVVTGDVSLFDDLVGYYYYMYLCIGKKYTHGTTVRYGSYYSQTGGDTAGLSDTQSVMSSDTYASYLNNLTFVIPATSTRILKAGTTYRWVAGVVDDIN